MKVFSRPKFLRIVKKLRKSGKKVVFTNGCFDLLHAGHVSLLRKAKKYGDCLVVALNTDASVSRLKGNRRPLVPLKERMEVVAALGCVDFVTSFAEDTPERIIRRIRPDVLVKGGDWRRDGIVGREYVSKVVRVPLLKGHSTTELIKNILKAYGGKTIL